VTRLPGTGDPLASLPQATHAAHEETLAAGDLPLYYTDRLVEATSPLGGLFGREQLAGTLCRLPPDCPASSYELITPGAYFVYAPHLSALRYSHPTD
jgi:serine phosphatase RsbU (regulator of sigma subunit)